MEISLSPPDKLRAPKPGEFDASPKAVREWTLTFNTNNTGETTRAIYRVLRLTNTLHVPTAHRLELLDRIGLILATIAPKLLAEFSHGVFPLSERSAKVAQLAVELQVSMIVGYRLVLHESNGDNSWLKRLGGQKHWVVAAHRLLYHFGTLMHLSQLLHRPYPRGLWSEFHQLFKAAVEGGRVSERVALNDGGNLSTTLEHEYKRILLMALLPPHRFTQAQLKEVCGSMDVWIGQTRLIKPWKERDLSRFNVLVSLDGDNPPLILPRAPDPEENPDEWLLSTVALNKQLRALLEQNSDDDQPILLEKRFKVSRTTLQRLLQFWCNPPLRREERLPGDAKVEVCAGISAIHEGLALQEEARRAAEQQALAVHSAPAEPEPEELPEFGSGFNADAFSLMDSDTAATDAWGVIVDDDDDNTLWDPLRGDNLRNFLHSAPSAQPASVAQKEEKQPLHYVTVKAQVVNFSKHGYRLCLPPHPKIRLKVGELICIEQPTRGRNEIGTIRWMQEMREEGEQRILIGVRLILHNAIPARLLISHKGTQSAPQPCLLGVHNRQFTSLVLPALPGLRAKQLMISMEERNTQVLLDTLVLNTTQFEMWHIHAKDRRLQLAVKGLNLDSLRLQLTVAPEELVKESKAKRDGEEFNNLWDTL